MLSRFIALLLILVLLLIVLQYPLQVTSSKSGLMALSLGIIILGGYLWGEILVRFKLPRISGYLFAGMLLGPYLGNILSHETIKNFYLIDQIALALIALSAGGELHLSSVKRHLKGIAFITLVQCIVLFAFGTGVFYLLSGWIPFLKEYSPVSRFGASMVFGVISVAQSPATTIAIITETKSSGIITELLLGVAVIKDVLVILFFAILIPTVKVMELGGGFEWEFLFKLGFELVLSFIVGMIAGMIISFYLKYVRANPVLFVLAFSYLVSEGSKTFHLDTLIVCIMAGLWVTNASKKGEELIKMIENSSLIIYVIFFCITGAALNLLAIQNTWELTLILIAARMLFLFFSTYIGCKAAKVEVPIPYTFWSAFLPQAGVSLGLITVLKRQGIPWGGHVEPIIIATIALNQIIGPITMKIALQRAGETNKSL